MKSKKEGAWLLPRGVRTGWEVEALCLRQARLTKHDPTFQRLSKSFDYDAKVEIFFTLKN